MSTDQIMVALFCWFFDDEILSKLAQYTNAKAKEKVHKIRVVGEHDKVVNKVSDGIYTE